MTKFKPLILILLLAGSMFASPLAYAAGKTSSGLIPCGNDETAGKVTAGQECTYDDLIKLAQTVINFLIFGLAAPLGAIMFAYAGYLYITNGGNESQIKQAHDIFLSVFWGLIVALAAWLLVNFIFQFLVDPTLNFLG